MKKLFLLLFFVLVWSRIYSQQDSIFVHIKLQEDQSLKVEQKIIYHNPLSKDLSTIKLLNWIAAYKNRKTPLLKRKLQDQKKEMYFAKPEELGGMSNLSVEIDGQKLETPKSEDENIFLSLPQILKTHEKVHIHLNYTLKLPNSHFTGYGISDNGLSLKYFFIVPDSFETNEQDRKFYLDTEEIQNTQSYWNISLELPTTMFAKSNLPETQPSYFSGKLMTDPEILISSSQFSSITTEVDGQGILVDFGYPLTMAEKQNLEFLLPLELKYIKNKLGTLPGKIFISQKFRNDEDFIGNNDIRFWKFHYKLFNDTENADMDYLGILTKNILNQSLSYNKSKDHWLINGLKSYVELQYLKKFYSDKKLLGALPEEVKLFGIKPLKWFHASKLKLTDRYGLAYQYIETENFDQKINLPFEKLSNFNNLAISNFETGLLFGFIAEKMGTDNFDTFVKNFVSTHSTSKVNNQDFLDGLREVSKNSSSFLDTFLNRKQRVNFNLKSFNKENEGIAIKISKNTPEKIPLKVEVLENTGFNKTFWFDTTDSEKSEFYKIPVSEVTKIIINNDYSFPESNYRDNYLYTKGFFSNAKRLKLKLFTDIPNPEYNEIFLNPRLGFNVYDKLLLGLNFRNSSLFRRKFAYSVTPYYSTGTRDFTGSGGVSYTFMPPESFFRFLSFGVSGSYFHYDYNLSYSQLNAGISMDFVKDARSDISRSVGFSYSHFEKDLNPLMILNQEYSKYNLWNLSYGYSNRQLIHEKSFGGGIQMMEDFKKVSGEFYYRYEYAKNKKVSFRVFTGIFLNNHTRNNFFDFGISRISNYSFSFGLLGQSATSGILSQQFVLADGGFKSYIGTTANQWISSVNIDGKIWKLFHLYADAGVYKNKGVPSRFIWDSGVKVAVIPDFLEIYFPIQSSLGFEPGFKDYGNRIRYSLALSLGSVINYFRKGVF